MFDTAFWGFALILSLGSVLSGLLLCDSSFHGFPYFFQQKE
jgi:hypothetical protein